MKRCVGCKLNKQDREFYNKAPGRLTSRCKLCHNAKSLQRYAANRAAIIVSQTAYNKANPHVGKAARKRYRQRYPDRQRARMRNKKHRQRARLRNLTEHHTETEWQAVLDRFGRQCLRCGWPSDLVRDHVVPLACGGSNTADNLQPLCTRCNEWKGAKAIDFRVSVTAY